MRAQLVSWLMNEIIPSVKGETDASDVILKFAAEQNLAPAAVQGLGQLFNTAASLAYWEKCATKDRGNSFPILNVDGMLDKYLEVRPKAATRPTPAMLPEEDDLPACLETLRDVAEVSIETKAASEHPKDRQRREEDERLHQEWLRQAYDDVEDRRAKQAGAICQFLQQNSDYSFQQLERDSLYALEDTAAVRRTLDGLAKYASDCYHIPVERASDPGARRLLSDVGVRVLPLVETLHDLNFMQTAVKEEQKKLAFARFKTAMSYMAPKHFPATDADQAEVFKSLKWKDVEMHPASGIPEGQGPEDLVFPNIANMTKEEIEDYLSADNSHLGFPMDIESLFAEGGAGSPPQEPPPGITGGTPSKAGPPSSGKSDKGSVGKVRPPAAKSPSRPMFEDLNRQLTALLAQSGQSGLQALLQGLGDNSQDQVDRDLRDTHHRALLQQLLMTDEVLSEADPDQVASIYDTVRQAAPRLAGDINVMRVLLRSAVQHDGMSPFDLKGLLDTELAQQKVNAGAAPHVPSKRKPAEEA